MMLFALNELRMYGSFAHDGTLFIRIAVRNQFVWHTLVFVFSLKIIHFNYDWIEYIDINVAYISFCMHQNIYFFTSSSSSASASTSRISTVKTHFMTKYILQSHIISLYRLVFLGGCSSNVIVIIIVGCLFAFIWLKWMV